ncbi:50S ribosomal protein L17 [bacterium CG10_46_32]|nr:MAG: 50S ribosomal protein L17 [bacterium CG10_46_32]PIR55925.1 MAG: 50S ribosomal protein L17 [Parcubacteria group bacterium CG10_big_fil_rev_8_21_14_0_10_46_32]
MRHKSSKLGFGKSAAYRKALMRELAASLVLHEKIETTVTKAKALRPYAERLVTLAKVDSVAARRKADRSIARKPALKKLFEVIGPKYKNRPGGYLRIRKTGQRAGDSGEQAIISFV